MGQRFASPVGLAAGLDKNGVAVPAFTALGFGFLEVGTVTPCRSPATTARACSACRRTAR